MTNNKLNKSNIMSSTWVLLLSVNGLISIFIILSAFAEEGLVSIIGGVVLTFFLFLFGFFYWAVLLLFCLIIEEVLILNSSSPLRVRLLFGVEVLFAIAFLHWFFASVDNIFLTYALFIFILAQYIRYQYLLKKDKIYAHEQPRKDKTFWI